MASVIGASV